MIRWVCMKCHRPGKFCECRTKRKIKLIMPIPEPVNCRHSAPWTSCRVCSKV